MRPVSLFLAAGLGFVAADIRAADPATVLDFTGRLEAARAEVRPRVTGYVTEVRVKEGAAVKKGDVLVELDPRAVQADLALARARRAQAEADAKLAAATVARARRAVQTGTAGMEELEQAAAAEAKAAAGLALARVEMERAELRLSGTKITTPIDGRVGRIGAAPGDLAAEAGPPLATVYDTSVLSVVFDVDERTLLKLRRAGHTDPAKLGVAVGLADENGFPHAARLDTISPVVDPQTGTARFRALLPNPKEMFSPGMFVRVQLSVPEAK